MTVIEWNVWPPSPWIDSLHMIEERWSLRNGLTSLVEPWWASELFHIEGGWNTGQDGKVDRKCLHPAFVPAHSLQGSVASWLRWRGSARWTLCISWHCCWGISGHWWSISSYWRRVRARHCAVSKVAKDRRSCDRWHHCAWRVVCCCGEKIGHDWLNHCACIALQITNRCPESVFLVHRFKPFCLCCAWQHDWFNPELGQEDITSCFWRIFLNVSKWDSAPFFTRKRHFTWFGSMAGASTCLSWPVVSVRELREGPSHLWSGLKWP